MLIINTTSKIWGNKNNSLKLVGAHVTNYGRKGIKMAGDGLNVSPKRGA
jgi:hypothetical protein